MLQIKLQMMKRDFGQRLKRLTILRISLLVLSSLFLINASQCNDPNVPKLNWNPQVFYGDSRTKSYVRQDGEKVEQIFCSNADFDNRVVLSRDEIAKAMQAYYDVVDQCSQWKK